MIFLVGPVGGAAHPLAEFVAGFGMKPLPHPLELFELNLSHQAQFLRAETEPCPHDFLAFGVIVVPLKVLRGVAGAVSHDSDGEHDKTILKAKNSISKERS